MAQPWPLPAGQYVPASQGSAAFAPTKMLQPSESLQDPAFRNAELQRKGLLADASHAP